MSKFLLALATLALAAPLAAPAPVPALASAPVANPKSSTDPRLLRAFRNPPLNNWTFVHLEGTPAEIGYQHGYLLAPEILENRKLLALEALHSSGKDWNFYRDAARDVLWPHIEQQYRDELTAIAQGAQARNFKLDVWDIVAINASTEWSYYVEQYDKQHGLKLPPTPAAGDHCSAFVATGAWTADGRPIIAHNNWSSYVEGERWTIVFDIVPALGHHFIMDGMAGLIHSGDDFGINDAGVMITETTISSFSGWDSNGIPEFVRGRKAMQYATSIDEFASIMKTGNNGGYANDWLIADRKTGEIASLELGLKNVTLDRTSDGYFVGSNYPINPKLAREETTFHLDDLSASGNARHIRWDQLMAENRGKIDVVMAQHFLGDHYDTYLKKDNAPSERTLCGHIDLSPRGTGDFEPPYGPGGAVQNKVADSAMAEKMMFTAAAGHACGLDYKAAPHLKAHPEFSWQKDYLGDMDAYPWTTFQASH